MRHIGRSKYETLNLWSPTLMFLMGVKKVSEAYFGYRISYERGSATVLKKLEDSR